MFIKKGLVQVCYLLLVASCYGSHNTVKRGVLDENYGNGAGYQNYGGNDLGYGNGGHGHAFLNQPNTIVFAKPVVIQKVRNFPPVSPAEIASAISAAKEAASQVQQAQQRVQLAKESVLNQQRIASHKEVHASIAAQKAEAAAAVQRQEANSAATSVVLAQQRLAHAKADVAEHQRLAAAREAHAAHIIQKSASAAAEEIRQSEHTHARFAALQRSEATAFKHASASKEATLSAASAAVAASASHYPAPTGPWMAQGYAGHGQWQ